MRISRSKIELFLECPRCFYFDVVHKKSRPAGFPLNLNNAVDVLLKREFDLYREKGRAHPLQKDISPNFIPANHPLLDVWRNSFAGGISYFNNEHQCTYFGAIDDIWVNEMGEFAIVDYKATAKAEPVLQLPAWANSYRRQISFYAYLLRKNNLAVYNKGYFIYLTALIEEESFNNRLNFTSNIIEIEIDETWIEPTLISIQKILRTQTPPLKSDNCKYCYFVEKRIL